MSVVVIEKDCRGCTKCVKSCPFDAITMENKKAVIGIACTSCGTCIEVCPFDAIVKDEVEKEEHDLSLYHDIWVFAEQRQGQLQDVALELLGEGKKMQEVVSYVLLFADRILQILLMSSLHMVLKKYIILRMKD